MTKLSLHTRIHYLKCKSFGLGFLYSITKNRLFFDKKIRTGIVLIALMNMLAGCGNRGSELKTNSKQDTTSKHLLQTDSIVQVDNAKQDSTFESCYLIIEEVPIFPEGDVLDFLRKNTIYPDRAREKGIQGKVITQFEIDYDGSVINVKVIRGVCSELDAEAVRVIKLMPKWIPGKQHNVPGRTKYTLPINFKLK